VRATRHSLGSLIVSLKPLQYGIETLPVSYHIVPAPVGKGGNQVVAKDSPCNEPRRDTQIAKRLASAIRNQIVDFLGEKLSD